ncbi:MAG: PAS domain-containing protein [Chlorobiaceae bacterium]|nr:PAS domain-containing protein [Chlorobiaceae bacterium]
MPYLSKNTTSDANLIENTVSALFRSFQEPVYVIDPEGTVLDANIKVAERFGMELSMCIGSNIYDLIDSCDIYPEGSGNRRKAQVQTVLGTGKPISFDEELNARSFKYDIYPVYSPEGTITRLFIISQDVTQQKTDLQTYKDIRNQWEFTLEKCQLGGWGIDLLDGKAYLTPEHARLFDYEGSPTEWKYELFREAVIPEDRERIDRLFHEITTNPHDWSVEYRIRKKNGELRWVLDIGGVERNDNGEPLRLLGVSRDITFQKLTEKTNEDFQAKMNFALQSAQVAVWEQNLLDGTVSRTHEHDRLFGYDSQLPDWTFETFMEHIHEEDRAGIIQNFHERTANPQSHWMDEFRIRKVDGEVRWLSIIGSTRFDDHGKPESMTGIVQDITDRKQAEINQQNLQNQLQQSQKMELVGQLAGGVAHDFNNVLAAILGHSELLLAKIDRNHPFFDSLDVIKQAANRSADIVRQLLGFARKQHVQPTHLLLDEEIGTLLNMLGRLIRENIQLDWKPENLHSQIYIDPAQLVQIITNLVVNAQDAIADRGTIRLATSTIHVVQSDCDAGHACSLPGDYVMLSVSDTGTGIDRTTLPHIFEPFFTTKEVGKGTGLGLATVYGIIKQNDGYIECQTEEGKGTTFNIYLPLCQDATILNEHSSNQHPGEKDAQGLILLVDDKPEILNIIKKVLVAQHYTILTAPDAKEAIRIAGNHAKNIKLLISDIILPDMNGIVLSKTLLLRNPDLKSILMSSYSAESHDHYAASDDDITFISKPFTIRGLIGTVSKVLSSP